MLATLPLAGLSSAGITFSNPPPRHRLWLSFQGRAEGALVAFPVRLVERVRAFAPRGKTFALLCLLTNALRLEADSAGL